MNASNTPMSASMPAGPAAGGGRSGLRFASGLGLSADPVEAAAMAAEAARAGLAGGAGTGPGVDLVQVFAEARFASRLGEVGKVVARALSPRCVIGVTAQGVIAGRHECEERPAVSVLAASLPGVELTPFCSADLPLVFGGEQFEAALGGFGGAGEGGGSGVGGEGDDGRDRDGPQWPREQDGSWWGPPWDASVPGLSDDESHELNQLSAVAGLGPGHRGTIVFADPFSVPLGSLLPALGVLRAARARSGAGAAVGAGDSRDGGGGGEARGGPIIGGLASGARRPRSVSLLLNDRVMSTGLVGVSVRGAIRVESLVSQGCRGFGPTMVVTGARGPIIRSLGGRPALEAMHTAIESLPLRERGLLARGLFIGRVVNEYKERFGRDDFLIRQITGVSRESGELAVADSIRPGQTVRFHVRDDRSASDDLAMLLDAQELKGPALGALLVTCNGRGQRLFARPHHDAEALARLFAPAASPGETLAKGGAALGPEERSAAPERPAVAGFFAAGEIGPVGEGCYLHGHTACAAIFRAP